MHIRLSFLLFVSDGLAYGVSNMVLAFYACIRPGRNVSNSLAYMVGPRDIVKTLALGVVFLRALALDVVFLRALALKLLTDLNWS